MNCSETWAQAKARSGSLRSADMKAQHRISGFTYKENLQESRVTNEAVIKMTGPVDLDKLQSCCDYDGNAMFTGEKMAMRLKQQTMFQFQGKDLQEGLKTLDRWC